MKFLNWFAKYIGLQGLLALILTIMFCIMQLRGQPLNPEFWGILGIVFGFYFAKNGVNFLDHFKGGPKEGK